MAAGKWIQSYPHLASVNTPVLNDDIPDKVLWKKRNGDMSEFSIRVVWEDMRPPSQKVKWEKLVWYSQGIPRHSFILWLAIRERLQTQDRMMK